MITSPSMVFSPPSVPAAAVKKLFEVLAARYANRAGGFCRIYRAGLRQGDNAQVAIVKLVE